MAMSLIYTLQFATARTETSQSTVYTSFPRRRFRSSSNARVRLSMAGALLTSNSSSSQQMSPGAPRTPTPGASVCDDLRQVCLPTDSLKMKLFCDRRSVDQSASQPVRQSACRAVSYSARQPVGQSASRSIGHFASRPVRQSACRPVGQSASP
jgi:hypothetical protein